MKLWNSWGLLKWIGCFVKTVECFQFVLPLAVHLFLFTVLVVCFEWKKYCQIHSAHILYFSWNEKPLFYCLNTLKPSKYSWQFAVVCCCFVQLHDQWHIINSSFIFARAVVCHRAINKELEVTICEVLFASSYCSCTIISLPVVSFQS